MASTLSTLSEVNTSLDNYCFHVFPFSLYSIMARFTYVLGQRSRKGGDVIHIENRLVNLHRDENVSESYLLTVNPKGQVRTAPFTE